jgi:hypothetical protein
LLAEVFYSALSIQDALKFMAESRERFIDARTLIVTADELSVKTGSIASDGSSLPRFKITA